MFNCISRSKTPVILSDCNEFFQPENFALDTILGKSLIAIEQLYVYMLLQMVYRQVIGRYFFSKLGVTGEAKDFMVGIGDGEQAKMDRNMVRYWKCNFPMTRSVRLLVSWLVGRSVFHNFLKGREVTLPCSYGSTCSIKVKI